MKNSPNASNVAISDYNSNPYVHLIYVRDH